MKKTIWIIVVIVIVIIAIYMFSRPAVGPSVPATSNTNSGESVVVPIPTSVSVTTSPAVQNATVSIKNFAFSPAVTMVKKGAQVTWINGDGMAHSIVSGSLIKSTPLQTGESFSFTFNTVGTFNYNCGIHPSMTGKVVVTE